MIGTRTGSKGVVTGSKVGSSTDDESGGTVDPLAGVTRDAASGKYFPASAAEWDIVLSVAGVSSGGPSALWLCQEASGNLADTIGAFTLTAGGAAATYQQAITGYTRKGIALADGATSAFTSSSLSLPSLLTQSQLVLAVIRLPVAIPGTGRAFVSVGSTGTRLSAQVLATTGKYRAQSAANAADGAASICDGTVHPVVIRHNRTASEADGYTDVEKLQPTFGATTAGQEIKLGNSLLFASASAYLYACSFHLGSAELSDAQVKAILQVLGWTVAW